MACRRSLARLERSKQLYEWKHDDGYPPHLANVPEVVDKPGYAIFNVTALLQTAGMLVGEDKLSSQYFRLAPNPKAPKSFASLIKHNQKQRAPKGVNDNMLFKYNIGKLSTCFPLLLLPSTSTLTDSSFPTCDLHYPR